jgi:hypothetical protein
LTDLKTGVERSLKALTTILRALQASGGYKYRELLKCTDKELEELVKESVPKLHMIVISLWVAEAMLKEKQFKLGGDRWGEYQKRRDVLIEELKATKK